MTFNRRRTEVRRAVRRYLSPKVKWGVGLLGFFVLLGTIGPLFEHGDPTAISLVGMHGPSAVHWLGTTEQGQGVLMQLVDGTAPSLEVGFLAAALGTGFSVIVGLAAGYLRGVFGESISLVSNVFLVIPSLPLVIVLAGYIPNGGELPIAVVIAVTTWAGGARLIRAQTLSMADREYVLAARAVGESPLQIMIREILPNIASIVMSTFLFSVIAAIATEAGLAFLGLGNVTSDSWGYMIHWAQADNALLLGAWWWWVPPGLCYALVGAALGLINFGLDEVANPRLRRVVIPSQRTRAPQLSSPGSRTGSVS